MKTAEVFIARFRDCEAISNLLLISFREFQSQYTKDAFHATCIQPDEVMKRMVEGIVWISKDNAKITGTLSAVGMGDGFYIRGMAVSPENRSKKIGYSLLLTAEKYAQKNNFERLFLNTTPFLHKAISLYEKYGFKRVSPHHLENFYGTPVYTMEKICHPGHFG